MPDKDIKFGTIATNVALNPEHRARLNLKEGPEFSMFTGDETRESQVIQYVADATGAYSFLKGIDERTRTLMLQMFAIGYRLRGVDGLLDFDISEEEVIQTIFSSLLIGDMPGAIDLIKGFAQKGGSHD